MRNNSHSSQTSVFISTPEDHKNEGGKGHNMPGSDKSEERSELIAFGGPKWNDLEAKTRKKCELFVSARV